MLNSTARLSRQQCLARKCCERRLIEGSPCLKHRRGQAHVAVAIALRRERECVALLAGRVCVRPLAGVGRVGGAGGDVADRDALVREVVQKAAVFIHRLAGPARRADVDGRRAARAVLVRDVEDGQPVAFEGPAATTGWCVPVCMQVRHASVRCAAAASHVFGIQRCKARVRPERGGHGARECVVLEVDLGHCWQKGDRVGDGADEAVPLEEAASKYK
jgi:hypothetical protein